MLTHNLKEHLIRLVWHEMGENMYDTISSGTIPWMLRMRFLLTTEQGLWSGDEAAAASCLALFGLLLGLLGAHGGALLLLVNDEASPTLLLVPLESREDWFLELIVGLGGRQSCVSYEGALAEWGEGGQYLLLELLVDCV